MNAKSTLKMALDCLMVVLLPLLMAYSLVGEELHEWLGASMFLLFLGHHALNRRWYRSLAKGKWTARRLFRTFVNAALLLCMLGLMVSGVILSRYVFDFLPIKGGRGFTRTLHMLSSYWGFCLKSLHLGMHWNMVMGTVKKLTKSKWQVFAPLRQLFLIIMIGYGLYAVIHQKILTYLFLRSHFVFFNFGEDILIFLFDYTAIMGLVAAAGYYADKHFPRSTA